MIRHCLLEALSLYCEFSCANLSKHLTSQNLSFPIRARTTVTLGVRLVSRAKWLPTTSTCHPLEQWWHHCPSPPFCPRGASLWQGGGSGWGPNTGGGAGKVWPEPLEPGLQLEGRSLQVAALGRLPAGTGPGIWAGLLASGDPGVSFGTTGQALSLITRGPGQCCRHSHCAGVCGN